MECLDNRICRDVVTHSFPDGRLGNILYYTLQAYILSRKGIYTHKYLCRTDYAYWQLSELGLSSFSTLIKSDIHFNHRPDGYAQQFGKDFTQADLHNFISEYILKSNLYKQVRDSTIDYSRSVALHVRNGDYFNYGKLYTFFDREDYLNKSIKLFDTNKINSVFVFSDDIKLSEKLYSHILKRSFKNIIYVCPSTPEYDLVRLSLFKNKILFNSTFSVWSGYIGDTIYKDFFSNVVCPSKVLWGHDSYNIYSSAWTKIDAILSK